MRIEVERLDLYPPPDGVIGQNARLCPAPLGRRWLLLLLWEGLDRAGQARKRADRILTDPTRPGGIHAASFETEDEDGGWETRSQGEGRRREGDASVRACAIRATEVVLLVLAGTGRDVPSCRAEGGFGSSLPSVPRRRLGSRRASPSPDPKSSFRDRCLEAPKTCSKAHAKCDGMPGNPGCQQVGESQTAKEGLFPALGLVVVGGLPACLPASLPVRPCARPASAAGYHIPACGARDVSSIPIAASLTPPRGCHGNLL